MSDDQIPQHPYCPFSRQEWEARLSALGSLLDAKIEPVANGITGIHTRLDTLNGKVANHETRLTTLETKRSMQSQRRSDYLQVLIGLSGWGMWAADKWWW